MKYEVYIDSLFAIHFTCDYCVMMLTASILKLRTTTLRMLIASTIGAIGGCLMVIMSQIPVWFRLSFVFWGIGAMMVFVAFRVRGMLQYVKMLTVILTLCFMIGGVAQWINGAFCKNNSTLFFVGSIWCVYAVIQSVIRISRKYKTVLYPVSLTFFDGENIEQDKETHKLVIALLDTGNLLTEPKSQDPVCILEQSVCGHFIPEHFIEIPCHSIGKNDGFLKAFPIQKAVIHTREGDIVCDKMWIALYDGKLTSKGKYQMILHPEYFEMRK